MLSLQQLVIMSGELSENSQSMNDYRTKLLKKVVSDWRFTECKGHYKGNFENSLMIALDNAKELNTLKEIAFKQFMQESILYRDSNGLWSLEFSNGTSQILGTRYIELNETTCKKYDNYTKLSTGHIFTIRS